MAERYKNLHYLSVLRSYYKDLQTCAATAVKELQKLHLELGEDPTTVRPALVHTAVNKAELLERMLEVSSCIQHVKQLARTKG